ncbi:hypothetical protein ACTD5D_21965 [Nocardia takedensis]|uniref:hypothetical protein n=1 Tax=Nocardia takedensis TaxID=259390 RepID=UPI003F76BE88
MMKLFAELPGLRRYSGLEDRVVNSALNGTELVISEIRPDAPNDRNRIPGELVHQILSGAFGSMSHRGLRLQGFYIDGSIDLSYMKWSGQLALKHCHISGDLSLERARVTGEVQLNGTWVDWVNVRHATIDGSLALQDGFRSASGLYAIGVKISGGLYLQNSTFIGPKEITYRTAIELFRSTVGDLFLTESTVSGGMCASGMTVERNVRLQGTAFISRDAMGWDSSGSDYRGALSLANCEIEGNLYFRTAALPQFSASGGITLLGASCRQIFIRKEIFERCKIQLDSFSYGRLRGITAHEWLETLDGCEPFRPRAYIQLAEYCSTVGDLSTRRRTLVTLEKRSTEQLPRWSKMRLVRSLYGMLVGYGYSASRAIIWLVFVVVSAASILHWGEVFALKTAVGQPQSPAQPLGWSDSFRVVADSFMPFAPLGMKDYWVAAPTSRIQWAQMTGFMLLRIGAWALTAMALLSVTNVVRNHRT